jgi:hypothetical protein
LDHSFAVDTAEEVLVVALAAADVVHLLIQLEVAAPLGPTMSARRASLMLVVHAR